MRHRDESSDEEPGRSGLGRAKKRARREESRKEEEEEEEGQRIEEATKPRTKLEKPGVTQVGEGSAVNDGEETGDVDMKTAPDSASNPVPNGAESAPDEGMKKRKRKKKKKKKGKEKSEEATVE
ncbi:hypothetical protein RRF57_010901 [Xylaria bambusicola]|uniref:Uncharacterized protein n=1 Tax=Xylaria bambusicola TaxID=326684 RepID=A0AAN7V237_9PEZI